MASTFRRAINDSHARSGDALALSFISLSDPDQNNDSSGRLATRFLKDSLSAEHGRLRRGVSVGAPRWTVRRSLGRRLCGRRGVGGGLPPRLAGGVRGPGGFGWWARLAARSLRHLRWRTGKGQKTAPQNGCDEARVGDGVPSCDPLPQHDCARLRIEGAAMVRY